MTKKADEETKITFDGYLTAVNFDTNKDELPFQFKLDEPQDQIEAIADLTASPKAVLSTIKSLLRHNGKMEVKIEKSEMRGKFWDASSKKEVDILTSEPIHVQKIVIESFIKDKTCKASVFYKGPRNLKEHNKLAQHAGHKIKLALSIPQSELFDKKD